MGSIICLTVSTFRPWPWAPTPTFLPLLTMCCDDESGIALLRPLGPPLTEFSKSTHVPSLTPAACISRSNGVTPALLPISERIYTNSVSRPSVPIIPTKNIRNLAQVKNAEFCNWALCEDHLAQSDFIHLSLWGPWVGKWPRPPRGWQRGVQHGAPARATACSSCGARWW